MISFIICSISPKLLAALEKNIKETIGNTTYEIIAFDNREYKYGIAKVYNLCAQKAKYKYLCFLHEDVLFHSQGWGNEIEHKLQEETCGIVGFTGSAIKFKSLSSVHPSARLMINHYTQRTLKGEKILMDSFSNNTTYISCITIDGMCMFVRKEILENYHFDEQRLPGFHGYDLDFSLQIAEHYQNYICGTILLEHFSTGSFSTEWVETIVKLHQEKWENKLPFYTKDFSREQVEKWEEDAFYRFIKKALRTNYPFQKTYGFIKQYWKITKFQKHSFTLLIKLIGIRFLHLKI